jgi:hypothetical protein
MLMWAWRATSGLAPFSVIFCYFRHMMVLKLSENSMERLDWVFSAVPNPIDLKLSDDIRVSTSNSLLCLFYCLFTFCKHKKTKQFMDYLGIHETALQLFWHDRAQGIEG